MKLLTEMTPADLIQVLQLTVQALAGLKAIGVDVSQLDLSQVRIRGEIPIDLAALLGK